MSRNLPAIPEHQLALLKQRIEHTWGRRINISADCERLHRHMVQVTGQSISPNTLRRIFGFLETKGGPSMHSKGILARYCGYDSWELLVDTGRNGKFPVEPIIQDALFYLDFFGIEVKHEGDINYHNACRKIAKRILESEPLFNKLAEPLAMHKTAQVFFYERFPWPDGLAAPYYQRGIRLYLQYKRTREAQLFGNSLLFLSALLCNEQASATAAINRIAGIVCPPGMHHFITARRLGSLILYKKLYSGEDYSAELEQVHRLATQTGVPEKVGFWRFPYFHFMIADYLNLAGLFADSHQVVASFVPTYGNEYVIEQGYLEAWEVVRHMALHERDPEKYRRWFEQFNQWDQLDFLFHKFYRLQALAIYCRLNGARQVKKKLQEKQDLVQNTGFVFFDV